MGHTRVRIDFRQRREILGRYGSHQKVLVRIKYNECAHEAIASIVRVVQKKSHITANCTDEGVQRGKKFASIMTYDRSEMQRGSEDIYCNSCTYRVLVQIINPYMYMTISVYCNWVQVVLYSMDVHVHMYVNSITQQNQLSDDRQFQIPLETET